MVSGWKKQHECIKERKFHSSSAIKPSFFFNTLSESRWLTKKKQKTDQTHFLISELHINNPDAKQTNTARWWNFLESPCDVLSLHKHTHTKHIIFVWMFVSWVCLYSSTGWDVIQHFSINRMATYCGSLVSPDARTHTHTVLFVNPMVIVFLVCEMSFLMHSWLNKRNHKDVQSLITAPWLSSPGKRKRPAAAC